MNDSHAKTCKKLKRAHAKPTVTVYKAGTGERFLLFCVNKSVINKQHQLNMI